ncbi:hypothetical protein KKC60_01995 [Patescibacteria group bacterium]|nr:hypothetical protein [Patescibacteria group bacterium]
MKNPKEERFTGSKILNTGEGELIIREKPDLEEGSRLVFLYWTPKVEGLCRGFKTAHDSLKPEKAVPEKGG